MWIFSNMTSSSFVAGSTVDGSIQVGRCSRASPRIDSRAALKNGYLPTCAGGRSLSLSLALSHFLHIYEPSSINMGREEHLLRVRGVGGGEGRGGI